MIKWKSYKYPFSRVNVDYIFRTLPGIRLSFLAANIPRAPWMIARSRDNQGRFQGSMDRYFESTGAIESQKQREEIIYELAVNVSQGQHRQEEEG